MADETLMELIDAYAEARHVGGCHTYNAKTAEARAKVAASLAASAGSEPVAWTGGEEWEQLAWHLCAEEHGEDACDEVIWEGGPIPEPWGARWMKYESDAKRMIDLVRRFYAHPSPPEGAGWRPIAEAPEGQMVVVGWLAPEDTEHPERHDFDLLEDGCWQRWHDHAEHVQVIGGHGVSYTPPYTVWMPVGPIPAPPASEAKGA